MRHVSFFAACLCVSPIIARADGPPPASLAPDTLVKVKLVQPLKSNHERAGDRIHFETSEDLLAPDRSVLVPRGTPVLGTVTRAHHRGMLGKPGRLEFTIDCIAVSDIVRVPLRNGVNAVHGRDNSFGSIAAAAVLLGPGWLLINGREISLPVGREFTVFVDQKTALAPSGPTVAAVPSLAPIAPVSPAPAALLAAARPDLAHLQEFHLKNGNVITGSVATQKDGAYFVLTELGQVTINTDMISFIAPRKE